jgi:DNA-directed RNA polymerase subunit RPC12/RpoP
MDYVIGLTGLRPWRCSKCGRRFFARSVALRYAFTVHCQQCGNLAVHRIGREYVTGSWLSLPRWLHAPAYRCDPCRNRFFSIRKFRPVRPLEEKSEGEKRAGSRAASA